MKLIILIFTLCIFSTSLYSQEEDSITKNNSESTFSLKLDVNLGYIKPRIQVINNFGDEITFYYDYTYLSELKLQFHFFNIIYFESNIEYLPLYVESRTEFQTDDNNYNFLDYNFGLGLNYRKYSASFGMGKNKQPSYYETDTILYKDMPLDLNYFYAKAGFLRKLYYWIEFVFELEAKLFTSSLDNITIKRGTSRDWRIGFLFGNTLKIGPAISNEYINIIYKRSFYGLEEELNHFYNNYNFLLLMKYQIDF